MAQTKDDPLHERLEKFALGDYWKSTRHRSVEWTCRDVVAVASLVIDQMPDGTLHLLAAKKLKAKELIKLAKNVQYSCCAKDVINNQQWVRAFVTIMAVRVPSTFFVADVIRCVDNFFDGALLNACDAKEADNIALKEVLKLKKLPRTDVAKT